MFKKIVKFVFFGLILVAFIAFNFAMAVANNPEFFGFDRIQASNVGYMSMLVYTTSVVIVIFTFIVAAFSEGKSCDE